MLRTRGVGVALPSPLPFGYAHVQLYWVPFGFQNEAFRFVWKVFFSNQIDAINSAPRWQKNTTRFPLTQQPTTGWINFVISIKSSALALCSHLVLQWYFTQYINKSLFSGLIYGAFPSTVVLTLYRPRTLSVCHLIPPGVGDGVTSSSGSGSVVFAL